MTSAGVVEAKDTYRGSFDNSATTSLHGACAFRKLLPPAWPCPTAFPAGYRRPLFILPLLAVAAVLLDLWDAFAKKKVLQAAYYWVVGKDPF